MDIRAHMCYNAYMRDSVDIRDYENVLRDRMEGNMANTEYTVEGRIAALEQEVEDLTTALQIVERTLYGVQQMLGKAAEYKGKPRGRLPR